MEELGEMLLQGAEQYGTAAIGFGLGVSSQYTGKMYSERSERQTFDLNETLLEEDSYYEEGQYCDSFIVERIMENEERIMSEIGDGLRSSLASIAFNGIWDAANYVLEPSGEAVDFQEYPEMAVGYYAGIKTADQIPTPQEISEFRDREPDGVSQEELYEKE